MYKQYLSTVGFALMTSGVKRHHAKHDSKRRISTSAGTFDCLRSSAGVDPRAGGSGDAEVRGATKVRRQFGGSVTSQSAFFQRYYSRHGFQSA